MILLLILMQSVGLIVIGIALDQIVKELRAIREILDEECPPEGEEAA